MHILVQPRASRARLGPMHDGRLKVAVTSPPVDGEANAAVIELLARTLGIPKRQIEIVSGESSQRKTIRIDGLEPAALDKVLAGHP